MHSIARSFAQRAGGTVLMTIGSVLFWCGAAYTVIGILVSRTGEQVAKKGRQQ